MASADLPAYAVIGAFHGSGKLYSAGASGSSDSSRAIWRRAATRIVQISDRSSSACETVACGMPEPLDFGAAEAVSPPEGGSLLVTIWIADDADPMLARQIVDREKNRTVENHCPGCGYDLRGHSGETRCPECGRAVRAPVTSMTCPKCSELSPGTFDVCWKCGADLDDAGDSTI